MFENGTFTVLPVPVDDAATEEWRQSFLENAKKNYKTYLEWYHAEDAPTGLAVMTLLHGTLGQFKWDKYK
jgi:hypothetical protein